MNPSMRSCLPYFRWFAKDWCTQTFYASLDDEQLGFFHRCLNLDWINGGLPADPAERARALRTPIADANRLFDAIASEFKPHAEDASKLVNIWLEEERKHAKSRSEKNSAAARMPRKRKRLANADQSLNERTANASPRARARAGSGSVSGSGSESGSGERTTTPEVSLAAPAAEELRIDLLESLLGLFIALGRGLTIPDRIKCENVWKGLMPAERIRAHDFAMQSRAEWQTRPTSKVPQPWNFLGERFWERAAPRLLAQTREPSRAETAHARAAAAFLADPEGKHKAI